MYYLNSLSLCGATLTVNVQVVSKLNVPITGEGSVFIKGSDNFEPVILMDNKTIMKCII